MPGTPRQFDVIVLGAGAAGLMCAAGTGQRGRRVALLEHNAQPGRKILISGGGRCNFTNIHCAPDRFLSENPHFAKSALALYEPQHFIELVNRSHIPWHEKTLGQLFCDSSAHAILNMLLAECERAERAGGSVDLVFNAKRTAVEREGSRFRVSTSVGEFVSDALVVATGGLSIPKLGATGLGYDLARQFGLRIVTPRPALVPLVLGGAEAAWTALAGVSTEVIAGARRGTFREKLLVTHRGLSGPAVLQASSYWKSGEPLVVDFAPDAELLRGLFAIGARRDGAALRQVLRAALPQRLASHLADAAEPKSWTNAALEACERSLHSWEFKPVGTEGFEKAEVTAGGVDTRDLQARTMEARVVPGLFFIGEAVDVTGHLGGFNFQWAWASAVAAGRAL
ncbi:MAG TPA: NAD(P)/FAD-dependent oxidoreductase [Terracidiphilus sp.]|jgi:predicted Rossmann fold flavoprotein|nr:NAD(P)/FAD-dependent oxidoreductase [Terracidiphilus sp.]